MAEPGHHSEPIAAVVITDELLRRPPADPDAVQALENGRVAIQ